MSFSFNGLYLEPKGADLPSWLGVTFSLLANLVAVAIFTDFQSLP